MHKKNIYPMTFKPVFKDYVWGGRNLAAKLGRQIPDGVIAESWEIAGHADGDTIIENGTLVGQRLSEALAKLGVDLIGTSCQWAQERNQFPLLIKLLDAQNNLSVQVHPNDEYALQHEENSLGKTEMWVALHAEKDAKIILGVKKGATPDKFKKAIVEGKLEAFLHEIPVRTGDHICVPAGSLHAIMGGLVIAEIQQNSNITYRVYDWNRLGADGKPRALHIDQSMDVINFDQIEPKLHKPRLISEQDTIKRQMLCQNQYFSVERFEFAPNATFAGNCDGSTFEIWGPISGQATISSEHNEVALSGVKFALLPAALGSFSVKTDAAATTMLRVYVDSDTL